VLGPLEKSLLAALLFVLMFGMGAGLTVANFRDVARRPFAPVIGLLSQFGWMPAIAYALARVLELDGPMAISLLVVGCVPGGTTSNLFTMYAKSDVALSISMTAISTVAGVVMMPLLLSLYAGSLSDQAFSIPTSDIGGTLAIMLVPLGIGMFVRARWPAAAPRVEAIGSYAGLGVLALLVITGLVGNAGLIARTEASMVGAAFGLGGCGFGLGYLGAALAGLPVAQRRAVSFETGIQNSPLAIGIIVATFPEASHEQMLWLPLLYALLVLFSASVLTLVWRPSG
jgi:BASS family bile acid:Na+ symporter